MNKCQYIKLNISMQKKQNKQKQKTNGKLGKPCQKKVLLTFLNLIE